MRLSFRLILSLILGLTLVSLLFAAYQVQLEKRGLRKDLQRRAEVLAESLAQNVEPLLEKSSHEPLQRMVERFGNREHLDGVAIYDNQGSPVAVTAGLTKRLVGRPATVARAIAENKGHGEFFWSGETSVHIYALPLHRGEDIVGGLAIVHDAAYIEAESTRVWHDTVLRVLIQQNPSEIPGREVPHLRKNLERVIFVEPSSSCLVFRATSVTTLIRKKVGIILPSRCVSCGADR